MPVFIDESLDLKHEEFWYGIIISCIAIPLMILSLYLLLFKKRTNTQEINTHEVTKENRYDYDNQTSWSLVDFAKLHGKMQIHVHTDADLNTSYLDLCKFTNEKGEETYAYISKVLKECTAKEIAERKDELSIHLMPSGKYCLCLEWVSVF